MKNNNDRIYSMTVASVYPHYVNKVEKKHQSIDDLHTIIHWLTGYSKDQLLVAISTNITFETFFSDAPKMNENVNLITGTICGHRIETIEDPLLKNIRYLDKLVDELSKGRSLDRILRK